jgi:NAD(P)-dependent dehydrogenase (short-subunit alcohol dehydrogenase family)
MRSSRVALVTGASSGIGRASALALRDAGWTVVATARRRDALQEIEGSRLHTAVLDVTDEASRTAVVAAVAAQHGPVSLLLNNAGFGKMGPVEDFPMTDWERLFATNVFGLVRMAQLVLPSMRSAGHGRIINVGSMGGEFTTPLAGAYHASKYAVEAVSDALRAEVKPFGVSVVLLQPGPVATHLATDGDFVSNPDGPYAPAVDHMQRTARGITPGRGILTPEQVARRVVKIADAGKASDRYKVGAVSHLLPLLRRWLPLGLWDRTMSRQSGLHLIEAYPTGGPENGRSPLVSA